MSKGSLLSSSFGPSAIGKGLIIGGPLINTGHSSDGITLELGSGEVASDLVLGKRPPNNLSSSGLPDGPGL